MEKISLSKSLNSDCRCSFARAMSYRQRRWTNRGAPVSSRKEAIRFASVTFLLITCYYATGHPLESYTL